MTANNFPSTETLCKTPFEAVVGDTMRPYSLRTIQVNIGLRCNLACRHCHVESSPKRSEEMTWVTMEDVLRAAQHANVETIDITGGAPEMHPQFCKFVENATRLGLQIIVRSNLTILLHPEYAHAGVMAKNRVHIIASLPCYLKENVDKQRGKRVYDESIEAIRSLNALGYGKDEALKLDLVFNPGGPQLPPSQQALEKTYKVELLERFGIVFNRLLTITNMPIGRFQEDLIRLGQAIPYAQLLQEQFNAVTVDDLMCRHQIHVGWDGRLHDCDFNYALGMSVKGTIRHIRDFDINGLLKRRIATANHCFGCTAGCGSSCTGALA